MGPTQEDPAYEDLSSIVGTVCALKKALNEVHAPYSRMRGKFSAYVPKKGEEITDGPRCGYVRGVLLQFTPILGLNPVLPGLVL